mmetsp:Transcript_7687/g.20804  ORF Transcript_7687/g.20804 Transcript_7687/m.20804 type:complete len:207 (+) Transcript_7687:36-656(+)
MGLTSTLLGVARMCDVPFQKGFYIYTTATGRTDAPIACAMDNCSSAVAVSAVTTASVLSRAMPPVGASSHLPCLAAYVPAPRCVAAGRWCSRDWNHRPRPSQSIGTVRRRPWNPQWSRVTWRAAGVRFHSESRIAAARFGCCRWRMTMAWRWSACSCFRVPYSSRRRAVLPFAMRRSSSPSPPRWTPDSRCAVSAHAIAHPCHLRS